PQGTGALTIGTAPNEGTLTAGGTILNQEGELNVTTNSANTMTINSVIANNGAGAVSLAKAGTGTLVLTGTNTYSGTTTIHGGTLEVGGAGTLGATTDAGIVNNGSFVYSSSATSIYGGVISGTGSITKSGTGTLTLAAANTYSGGTTLAAGRLNVNTATALGSGAITFTGGTLDNTSGAALTLTSNNAQNWNGDFIFLGTQNLNLGTGAVALNGNRSVTVSGSTLTVGGIISGTDSSLTKAGAGTLVLTGANTYTGGTTINGGTLQAGTPAVLPSSGIVSVGAEGTLSLAGTGGPVTYAQALSGTGRVLLTTSGAGDTYLSGVSTGFTGTLELSGTGGNKLNASNLKIGPSALIKINSGGQLFTSGANLANPIQVLGTGNTENRGGIRLNNGTLSGAITLLGNTTIAGEGGTITGTITGTAAAGETQTLTLGTGTSSGGTFNGIISDGSGGGKLAVTSSNGTNNLGGINTYSGATSVQGTSTLNLTGSIANSALSMAAGTTLRGEGTAASLTTAGALNLTIDPSTTGAFTSTGALALGGNVAVTLNGAAVPAAPFVVLNHGGTSATNANFTLLNSVNFRAPAFTVGATNVTLSLGNMDLTWTGTSGSDWNVNGTANWKDAASVPQKFFYSDAVTFNDAPGSDQTVTLAAAVQPGSITVDNNTAAYTIVANGSNVIAGGSLIKTGTGVLTMAGNTANTFAGGTTIEEGTISIEHGASLGTGRITIEEDGTLSAGADNLTIGNAMTFSGGTIDVTSRIVTNTTTFNGLISGTGDITIASTGNTSSTGGGQVGLGVRFNNGGNTFTGDITVTAGLFSYQTNAALGNPANKIILNGGGLLDNGTGVDMTHDVVVGEGGGLFRTYGNTIATLSGALTGSGDFRHTDGGRLILAGDLSGFTGVYDNQSGTTIVTGDKTSGGSWLISGGTLRYAAAGEQTWDNDITGGGILEVASGTLNLTGINYYTGVTNVTGGTLVLSGSVEGSMRANLTGGELRLEEAERLSDFATLHLGGGTFDLGGFSETLGSLSLTADSTIDFGDGNSLLSFGFASSLNEGMTLTIANWSGSAAGGGTDQLIFAEDMSAWLEQFSFVGFTGAAQIDHTAMGGGYEIVAVPEPSSLLLLGAAAGLLGFRRRNRSRR
ncbi:MAG: PEP-CTERM sorting domain-containing protein, partial [Verrucomicrobiaceae bacterium]